MVLAIVKCKVEGALTWLPGVDFALTGLALVSLAFKAFSDFFHARHQAYRAAVLVAEEQDDRKLAAAREKDLLDMTASVAAAADARDDLIEAWEQQLSKEHHNAQV